MPFNPNSGNGVGAGPQASAVVSWRELASSNAVSAARMLCCLESSLLVPVEKCSKHEFAHARLISCIVRYLRLQLLHECRCERVRVLMLVCSYASYRFDRPQERRTQRPLSGVSCVAWP